MTRSAKRRRPHVLIESRRDRLMTQAQLARKAHVAVRTVISCEAGLPCRMDTQRKLLAALGLPFERRAEVFGEIARGRRGA